MGSRLLRSGPEQIAKAETLFAETGDFRYVALAIGAAPIAPPFWAMWECVAEHHRTERRAKSHLSEVDLILDEMARQIAKEHFARMDGINSNEAPFPSLAEFIRRSCRITGLRTDKLEHTADDNWTRDIRRAWDYEQRTPLKFDAWNLPQTKMTERIDRIVTEMVGAELGLPTAPIRDLWLASITNAKPRED